MRSSAIVTAAFAAVVASTPLKRDMVTETDTATDLTYVTDVITVTAGEEAPATATSAPVVVVTTTAGAASYHWGHHPHHWHSSSVSAAAPSSSVVVSSESAPAAPSTTSSEVPVTTSSAPAAPETTSSAAPYSAPASSSASVAATTTSAAAASTSLASTYQQAVLDHHNYHRANHSAPLLVWDSEMESTAQEVANSCYYAHDMTKGTYGQNIAAGVEPNNVSTIITDMFYNNEMENFQYYNQANPTDNFEGWGHFSQIVWKGTTKVACVTKYCGQGGLQNKGPDGAEIPDYFTVCNYGPPGNVEGEFNTNIGQPKGDAYITWSEGLATPASGVTGDGY